MGLNKGSNGIYLSIADGQLTRQFKEATPNTTPRVNKMGKTVHEEKFRDITGYLVSLTKKENDYGVQYTLQMRDGDEVFNIQMPYSSRYSNAFLKALPNIDKTKPVKLMPWSMQDKSDATKKVTGLTMWQDDGNGMVKIPPAYTKDQPNGLPEMVSMKVKEKGKTITKWDSSEMEEFLEEVGKTFFSSIPAPTEQEVDSDEPPF